MSNEPHYAGNATIIDNGTPVACSGPILTSLPPQCGGLEIEGFDWDTVPWHEESGDVRWASVYIEFVLIGDKIRLIAPPHEAEDIVTTPPDFSPPCDEPLGGWQFAPGPLTTDEAAGAVRQYLRRQPDLSGNWVYQLGTPSESTQQEYVLVATFTGDLDRHRSEMEALWGGPICVAERPWTEADLKAIQDELMTVLMSEDVPGIISATSFSVDIIRGVVEVGAFIATEEGQRWLDARYGPGVVEVTGQVRLVELG